MAKAEERVPASVSGRALVVCNGGPRHGGWYFLDHGPGSWMERRRLAIAEGAHVNDAVLGYARTSRTIPHPRWEGVEGTVLEWEGGVGE